jgi:hypothetical protein
MIQDRHAAEETKSPEIPNSPVDQDKLEAGENAKGVDVGKDEEGSIGNAGFTIIM